MEFDIYLKKKKEVVLIKFYCLDQHHTFTHIYKLQANNEIDNETIKYKNKPVD